jgi:hypothetical protein
MSIHYENGQLAAIRFIDEAETTAPVKRYAIGTHVLCVKQIIGEAQEIYVRFA